MVPAAKPLALTRKPARALIDPRICRALRFFEAARKASWKTNLRAAKLDGLQRPAVLAYSRPSYRIEGRLPMSKET